MIISKNLLDNLTIIKTQIDTEIAAKKVHWDFACLLCNAEFAMNYPELDQMIFELPEYNILFEVINIHNNISEVIDFYNKETAGESDA